MPSDLNTDAVIFCRVSTAPQGAADRWSLPSQLKFNQDYAKAKGLVPAHEAWVLTERSDDRSERRKFNEMVGFIRQNRIGHLLVLNMERLSRGYKAIVELDDMIADFLTIHFTESGEKIDKDTPPEKRALWGMVVTFGRYEIENLRRKARRSYEFAYERGLYAPNCSLGYRSKRFHLSIDENERPYIIRAFELYSTGQESEWSLAEKLYAEGLRTRKGRKVSDTTLSRILNNPLYVGYTVWPFTESKYVSTPHYKGEWIKGQHEVIVDRDLFDKVQAVLKEKGRPHGKVKRFYVYRGLFKCGYCNRTMSGYQSKGINYYASGHPHGGRCEQVKCYREDELTKQIENTLDRFSFPPGLLDWTREMLKAEFSEKKDTGKAQRRKLEAEVKRLTTMIENAADDAFEGLFDRETIRKKVVGYQTRLERTRDQVARLDRDRGQFIEQGIIILDLVQDLKKAFHKATPEQRNQMLRILFKEVIVKDGKFSWRVNEPFASLYDIRLENRAVVAGKQGFEP